MAQDDVQIKIGVVGNQDILNVSKSIDALSNKTKKLAKDFDSGRSTSQAYFKGLNQQASALKKLGFSYNESRKYVFDLAKAQRESAKQKMFESQAREAARFEDELQNVLRSINPLKNATDAYTQKLLVLNTALRNGKIDAKQHALALTDLKTQAQLSGLVFNKQGGIVQGSSKNMKMFNMQVQQAGYQIGDFFTQVAMGQNPLMAFATQFSQLAGFFKGVWGPVIGAGIAILGALGVAFMNAQEEVKTLEDRLSDIKDVMSSAESATDILTMSAEDLARTYGDAAVAVQKFATVQAYAIQAQAASRFAESVFLAQTALGEFTKVSKTFADDDTGTVFEDISEAVRNTSEAFGVGSQDATNLVYALQDLNNAKNTDELQAALEKVSDIIIDAKGDLNDIPPYIADAIRQMQELGIVSAQTAEIINRMSAAAANISVGISPETFRALYGDNLLPPAQIPDVPKTRRGGGGARKKEDYLGDLLKEIEYKTSIVGLSEEEARQKELIYELTKKGLEVDDARIKKVLEAEAALKKATEAEENRKNMIENISNKMEEAFMSMVDGSKSVGDAFKGMIREILLDIYRQQVAKPMSNAISSLLGGFLGGSGGGTGSFGLPMPFADGGVVSRASMFPMSNGRTGVMGEAGPEAIMPLKRGKDGKLGVQMSGGSGTVVVNQSFHFSANGDESVKKIIAQAAPQIAMMTQQQIMDSRRRGGSMKATFG